MAGPILKAVGTRAAATTVTSITAAKPTITVDGLLLAVVTTGDNLVHTCSTVGWTKVRQDNSGTGRTVSLWTAQSSAASPTFAWGGGTANPIAYIAYFADDEANPLDLSFGAVAVNAGTASPLTVPSITATRSDSRFIYIAVEGNTNLNVPAGYVEHLDGSGSSGGVAIGSKASDAAGTVSGAISVTANTPANVSAYVMYHIEVMRETGPAPSFQSSKMATDVWLDDISDFRASKAEINAWIDELDQLKTTKVEVSVWLDEAVTVPMITRRRQSAGMAF